MRVSSVPTKVLPLVLLVGFSAWVATYSAIYSWHGLAVSPDFQRIFGVISAILVVLWIDSDSRDHPDIYRTFEFRYLVLLIFVLYLPYYLWRTRRRVGMLSYLGFGALFYSGEVAQLLIYLWKG